MERKPTFGDVLRLLREKAGYTSQREFARAAGLSQSTLVNLEKGSSRLPNSRTLTRIAAALGLSTQDLLARSEPVAIHTESIGEQMARSIPIDAEYAASPADSGFIEFEFNRRNNFELLRIVSDNLVSFRMFKTSLISVRLSSDIETGAICALELLREGRPSGSFCIRRKIFVEQLSNPDPQMASITYALDDLHAFDLMISPKNTNFSCIGEVSSYMSAVSKIRRT